MHRFLVGLALAAFVLAALALPALAQNADDPKAWAVAWLEQAANDPDKALERMRQETYLGQRINQAGFEQIRQAVLDNQNAAGAMFKIEPVAVRRFGEAAQQVTLMSQHRKWPVLYRFRFFRPPDSGWMLGGIDIQSDVGRFPWDEAEAETLR